MVAFLSLLFLCIVLFLILLPGIEPRTSCVLVKNSTTQQHASVVLSADALCWLSRASQTKEHIFCRVEKQVYFFTKARNLKSASVLVPRSAC